MNEIHKCFTYLIEKTSKLNSLTDGQKELILKDLEFFKTQALTDHDRRIHRAILQNRWKSFEMKVLRTTLLNEPKSFFASIHLFLGNPYAISQDQKEIARLNAWEPREFFEDLMTEYENKKEFLDKEEDTLLFCGLKVLLCESKVPLLKQDKRGINKAFRGVKPVLEKYGFFYKYQGASVLSSKLRLFLTGSV